MTRFTSIVAVAGANGDLGGRIAKALVARGATVLALVRPDLAAEDRVRIEAFGARLAPADPTDVRALATACTGAVCVVSALSGLRSVMIDRQSVLLDAAVAAGVPRFIPSDYAMDFTKIAPGVNRNFDLHRQFRERLERAPIRSTAVLNGAFMNLLTGEAPLVLFKIKRVLYWGKNANQLIDFTTMDDTAAYTAEAALDPGAPPILRIAGEQITAAGLAAAASDVSGKSFRLLRGGGLGRLRRISKVVRMFTPASDSPFPVWQGMQYLYCMFEGSGMLKPLDNLRYPNLKWTGVRTVLKQAV